MAAGAVSCRTPNASAQAQPAPTSYHIAQTDYAQQAKQKRITEQLCDIYQGNDKRCAKDSKTSVNKRADIMALGFKTKFLSCVGHGAGHGGRHKAGRGAANINWADLTRDAHYSPACFDDERCGFALEADVWRSMGANVICDLRRNAFDWASALQRSTPLPSTLQTNKWRKFIFTCSAGTRGAVARWW